MKKTLLILIGITMPLLCWSQGKAVLPNWVPAKSKETIHRMQDNGMMTHLDMAITLSNVGIGFDFATPMTRWAQLRMGGSFRPNTNYSCTLQTEISEGLTKEEQERRMNKLTSLAGTYLHTNASREVEVTGGLEMLNFKMLLDIYPIQEHRNLHLTVGFYWGNGRIVEGKSTARSGNILTAMNMYDALYDRAIAGEDMDLSVAGINMAREQATMRKKLRDWGALTVPVGTYSHDITAASNVYYTRNVTDEDGNVTHRAGELRYAEGEVMHKAGETVRLRPNDRDMILIDAKVSSFKPYIGMGYSLPLRKDGKLKLSLDAGVLLWGGHPEITTVVESEGSDVSGNVIHNGIDLTRDVDNIEGSLGELVDKAKKYGVMPEVTLRLSQRLW